MGPRRCGRCDDRPAAVLDGAALGHQGFCTTRALDVVSRLPACWATWIADAVSGSDAKGCSAPLACGLWLHPAGVHSGREGPCFRSTT